MRSVAGRRMLVLSDGVLPMLDLSDALGYPADRAPSTPWSSSAASEQRLALAVDELVGQRELVTRPLPPERRRRRRPCRAAPSCRTARSP